MEKKYLGLILLFATVFVALFVYKAPKVATLTKQADVEFPSNVEISSWIWDSPEKIIQSKTAELLDFCQKGKINSLYISIDDYIDLYEQPDSPEKTEKLKKYETSVKYFIDQAHLRNIKVQALAGNTLWANSSHQYIPPLLLDYALDSDFDGMQFDIEFYNQPNFNQDKITHSQDFLDLSESLINKVKVRNQKDFRLGFAIPYWFDFTDRNTPAITWDGTKTSVGEHLLNRLNELPNSYVVLMSYRDSTDGAGGSIEISKKILEDITKSYSNVSALVAIETARNDDKSITYSGQSRQAIKQAATSITNAYRSNPNFKGIAIHHLLSYQELPEN